MSAVVLFHHVQGLTPGVDAFAITAMAQTGSDAAPRAQGSLAMSASSDAAEPFKPGSSS